MTQTFIKKTQSDAVINTNKDELVRYKQAVQRSLADKALREDIQALKNEVAILRSEIALIKSNQ